MSSGVERLLQFYCLLVLVISTFVNHAASRSTANDYYRYNFSEEAPVKTCSTAACKSAADEIISYMDTSIKPCDDFYHFACGNFVKKSIIKNENSVNNSFYRVRERLNQLLKASLESEFRPGDPESFKKLKAYYNVCMDEDQKEKSSVAEFLSIFEETVGGWPVILRKPWNESKFDWIQTAKKLRKKGFSNNIFFDLTIGEDLKNSSQKRIFLTAPSLGINDEYLLENSHSKIKAAYLKYMIDVAGVIHRNTSLATRDMAQVINLKTALVKIFPNFTGERDRSNVYQPISIADLQRLLPYVPWLDYINTFLSPHKVLTSADIVVVIGFRYFDRLKDVLANTPKRVMANYIGWRMISTSVNSLSKKFKDARYEFNKVISGNVAKQQSWKSCLSHASARFPLLMGSLYVRRYFDESKKEKIEKIVQEMRKTFNEILQQIDWMDATTKMEALKKLNKMKSLVAYPMELLNNLKLDNFYEKIDIDDKSLIQTELNFNLVSIRNHIQSLDEPVNSLEWTKTFGAASTTNAFYAPITNSIILPAGILQSPFFDADLPKYVNYGSIGYVVGHEITHGFDDLGRHYDTNGNVRDWWDPKTSEKFINKTKCIVEQYNSYVEKAVGLHVNGRLTLGENIADNGGFKIAYTAYNKWQRLNLEEPRLPGLESYTPKQLFWIANAHVFCSKYRPEHLKNLMISDTHSPASARIIKSISNRPEFSDDFRCRKGSLMNPELKCSVW